MKAIKILVVLFATCLLFCSSSVAYAKVEGNIFYEGNGIVTEDGESFNIAEFNKALKVNNIAEAEAIYNKWFSRRQEMLKNGTEFGILDMYIKHSYAWILHAEKNYEGCIAIENEVLDYMLTHLNEGNENDVNWINQIYFSMRCKKRSYDKLKDYENGLLVQKDFINFCESVVPRFEKVFGLNSVETISVKFYLARGYSEFLRYSDAKKLYEEILKSSIEIYGEKGLKTLEIYDKVIREYIHLGNFKDAELLLNRLVPLAEEILKDDSNLKKDILEDQAFCYYHTRQVKKEEEVLKKILTLPINNREKILHLTMMASAYRLLDDYSNALNYILQAWDIYGKYLPENKFARVDILRIMGTIYLDLGNNDEGVKFTREAFDLSVELYGYDSEKTFHAMNDLIKCYSKTKQYDKAVELGKEEYALVEKLYGNDTPHKIYPMLDIANSYYKLDDYESGLPWAKEALNESLRICGEKNVQTLRSLDILAAYYMTDKDTFNEAIKIYEMLLETSSEIFSEEDSFIDNTMKNLALVYMYSPRWKEAIPLYEKIIDRFEKRMDNYGSLTVDEKRKLISDNSSYYIKATGIYLEDENFNDAFRTLERGKSRLLIDSYSEQLAKSSGILDKQEVSKLNDYKSGLANYANLIGNAFQIGDEQARFNLENEQRNLMNEYAAYKEALQNKYPKYKNASQANKLDFERDKNILPDDTAFVEYMVWDSKESAAFTFDKNSEIKAVHIDTPENFLSLCSLYREILEYPTLQAMQKDNKYLWKFPDGDYKITIGMDIEKGSGADRIKTDKELNDLKQTLSKNLGEILLTPIKENISGYSNVIFSPDGDLNNVPFETLEFNGELAINSFNVSYVPSFSVLKLMDEAGKKNAELTTRRDFFAMGNAFYGNNDETSERRSLEEFSRGMREKVDVAELLDLKWKNLDGTKEEIDRVAKMFGTKKIFSEKSASESNLKAFSRRDELSKYKYLLFAAHGIFIPYAPEYNSIVLSQGVDAKEDGYVTIGEWMGLNLNSDLVFLSACESGLGEYQAGEGIIGIPYALTIAGNKDTVMSLWKVQDKTTAEFVSTFFKKVSEGKSALVAINETKREFLKNPEYQNPAIWAPFLLYGF